jgi:DNA polymerase I-like protein with 3'-5' exonuclease and polymerase domains
MIYLVSNQRSLFETDAYKELSLSDAIDMIMPHSWVEYDSETAGLDPYTKPLLCTQYGLGEDQIVVDNVTIPIEKLKCVLEDPTKTFLGWNIAFDLRFLYHHKIVPYNVWDGMIAEKLLYLGYPPQFHSLSLKAAADNYLGIDIDKTVRGQIITQGLTIPVVQYAAGDVMYLTKIKEKQDAELEKKELTKAAEFEMKFTPVIAYMEYCGAKLDPVKWKQKMIRDKEEVNKAEAKLNEWVENYYNEHKSSEGYIKACTEEVDIMHENQLFDKVGPHMGQIKRVCNPQTGLIHYEYDKPFPYVTKNLQGDLFSGFDASAKCNINWSSSQQVVPLFEMLGLNCTTIDAKTKQKKKSADIKLIKPQAHKCSIVPLYVEYKKAKILVDTFGQKFIDKINPVSGRIHPDYFQLGADTGRLSATNPSLMNLPHDPFTRSCFISDTGYKWISCDYKGQESFLMASIANDKAMLDELINGSKDMHSLTAKMVFKDKIPQDMPTEKVKKQFPELRQEAKGYEFCFNYAGNASTLVRNYGIPKKRAQEIEDNYMNGFAGLKAYQERQKSFVVQHGYILLSPVTGHKAFIYDWDNLNRINDDLGTVDGQYAMQTRDESNPLVQEADFLRRRLSDSMKQSVNYPMEETCVGLKLLKFGEP